MLAEIAKRVDSSVRALEGALIRVVAYASLQDEEPTPGLVRHVLRRLGQDQSKDACGLSEIVDAAAQEFGVPRTAMLGRDRRAAKSAGPARSPCTSPASSPVTASPRSAGASAGADHTTVLHAINRIGTAVHADPAVRESVEKLGRRLGRPA